MKHKCTRVLAAFLTLMTLTSLLTMGVSAWDQLDEDKKCTVTMELTRPSQDHSGGREPLQGADVVLYKIARIRHNPNTNEQYLSIYRPYNEDPRLNWTGIREEEDYHKKLPVNVLLEVIKKRGIRPSAYGEPTDERGRVTIGNLDGCLYLVQLRNAEELECYMEPFLITLPRRVNGRYDYDGKQMIVKPKTEITEAVVDIVVKKVWKGDEKNEKLRPKFIEVQLLNGSQLAEEATLNKKNGWTYTFRDKPISGRWKVQEKKVKGYKGEVGRINWVDDHYEVVIVNTRDGSLVQTGELSWPIPLLMLGGALMMLSGYAMSHEKKKHE